MPSVITSRRTTDGTTANAGASTSQRHTASSMTSLGVGVCAGGEKAVGEQSRAVSASESGKSTGSSPAPPDWRRRRDERDPLQMLTDTIWPGSGKSMAGMNPIHREFLDRLAD